MIPMELTLILAATCEMGIGSRATLPWMGLKKEMAYFARVTKRLPPCVEAPAMNAVIMGRKTWDSIPPRFRPLQGRLNIVISRSYQNPEESNDVKEDIIKAPSLEKAITYLRGKTQGTVGRVFVIGGGQIYSAALELNETRRVLLTKVLSDFDCDTFFPLQMNDEGMSPPGWAKRSKEQLDSWVGETVPDGIQVENNTSYEFQMWERAT